jgi:DNA-binding transcriptional ArsR family regulator
MEAIFWLDLSQYCEYNRSESIRRQGEGMASKQVEAIVHPVRLRILMDVAGRERTPYEIGRALPDIAQASLYRHIKRLVDAGVLRVVRETPVRGATEKVYALAADDAGDIDRAEFEQISREDHLRYFADFLASLLGQYRLYLQKEQIDLNADGVTYRTTPVNLSATEYEAFLSDLRAIMQRVQSYPPAPERRRRLISVIQMPAAAD